METQTMARDATPAPGGGVGGEDLLSGGAGAGGGASVGDAFGALSLDAGGGASAFNFMNGPAAGGGDDLSSLSDAFASRPPVPPSQNGLNQFGGDFTLY